MLEVGKEYNISVRDGKEIKKVGVYMYETPYLWVFRIKGLRNNYYVESFRKNETNFLEALTIKGVTLPITGSDPYKKSGTYRNKETASKIVELRRKKRLSYSKISRQLCVPENYVINVLKIKDLY